MSNNTKQLKRHYLLRTRLLKGKTHSKHQNIKTSQQKIHISNVGHQTSQEEERDTRAKLLKNQHTNKGQERQEDNNRL
jgi:ribosomal protein L24